MKKIQVLAFMLLIISLHLSSGREDIAIYWDPFSQNKSEIPSGFDSNLVGQGKPSDDNLIQLRDTSIGKIPTSEDMKPLLGSRQEPLKGSKAVGSPNSNERIEVTIIMRSKTADTGLIAAENAKNAGEKSGVHRYLSREEFAAASAPDENDVARIRSFALRHGLTVVQVRPESNSIILSGTSRAVSEAFGIKLTLFESPMGTYRGYAGDIKVPSEIAPSILGVFGLDDRPIARPYYIRSEKSSSITYTPQQMTKLYNFPAGLDGSGQCIALIELGGGYPSEDVQGYFKWLKIRTPEIAIVSVDGADSRLGSDADGEVVMDVDLAGCIAPGSKIVVYFAPNTERGFIDAVNAAVHDATNRPSVISISWGAAESNWTLNAIDAMDQAFQGAAEMGVTVLCASGDDGSNDDVNDNLAHVDFPASSRYVTGCGGTRFDPVDEIVWNNGPGNATGGGVSDLFPVPIWQKSSGIPLSSNPGGRTGRGVPDIAGNADTDTGYLLLFRGRPAVFGGTSAVAPMWAGLIALINQNLGKPAGYLNPSLYSMANSSVFKDVTSGNNGAYQATKGWDACTGLGTLDGSNLMYALKGPDNITWSVPS